MKKLNVTKISVNQVRRNKFDKHFYNTEGVKKADKCLYIEAIEFFTKAVNLEPKDSLSYFNRASVKMSIGDITGAKLDFILSHTCS